MRSRCYLKLGNWQEALEGVNINSISPILKCYQQATDFDPSWYKAWHAWAYMNFESVLFYKNKPPEVADKNTEISFAVLAVQGFFK